jgi:hypothetical protein
MLPLPTAVINNDDEDDQDEDGGSGCSSGVSDGEGSTNLHIICSALLEYARNSDGHLRRSSRFSLKY